MALETLKGVEEIGGFKIARFSVRDKQWLDGVGALGPDSPIVVLDQLNLIAFIIQNGPIKEVGVNGCQVVTMIQTAKRILEKLNEKFPCSENQTTIDHLDWAIVAQYARTKNHEARNVEGTDQV